MIILPEEETRPARTHPAALYHERNAVRAGKPFLKQREVVLVKAQALARVRAVETYGGERAVALSAFLHHLFEQFLVGFRKRIAKPEKVLGGHLHCPLHFHEDAAFPCFRTAEQNPAVLLPAERTAAAAIQDGAHRSLREVDGEVLAGRLPQVAGRVFPRSRTHNRLHRLR